jgi:hypothetical protein
MLLPLRNIWLICDRGEIIQLETNSVFLCVAQLRDVDADVDADMDVDVT